MSDLRSPAFPALAASHAEVLQDPPDAGDSIVNARALRYRLLLAALALATSTALAATMPGNGTIVANPYGTLTVQGASLSGTTISNLQGVTILQLGSVAGTGSDYIEIDFDGLDIGAGNQLLVRAGAANQTVVLYNSGSNASTIAGTLQAQSGNSAAPPVLYLQDPNGIMVAAGGTLSAASGLTIDTLGATWTDGQPLVNQGTVDGGSALWLYGGNITGGGAFRGNGIGLVTYGNANNPVNGQQYLANGLTLAPSSGSNVQLAIGHYGPAPQVMNLSVNGNAAVWMPSAWPASYDIPTNTLPVLSGAIRAAGTRDPDYGAGSLIVQATGDLSLGAGSPRDFVFPGGIVLKAGGTLDLAGVFVTNGWTASGTAFQGMYFESPSIVSTGGAIEVLTNNLNWINFSTLPAAVVQAWQLVQQPDATVQYVPADSTAPHLNTYSTLINANAAGQCWTCLMNVAPVTIQ